MGQTTYSYIQEHRMPNIIIQFAWRYQSKQCILLPWIWCVGWYGFHHSKVWEHVIKMVMPRQSKYQHICNYVIVPCIIQAAESTRGRNEINVNVQKREKHKIIPSCVMGQKFIGGEPENKKKTLNFPDGVLWLWILVESSRRTFHTQTWFRRIPSLGNFIVYIYCLFAELDIHTGRDNLCDR